MREPLVIDTNVLVAANGESSCSRLAAFECVKRLRAVESSGCVVLDMDYEILAEYRKQWNPKKQPGAGFLFWKWLLNHKGNSECCHSVLITKLEPNGYAEFPDHDELRNFDASDKKFVAVSVAHLSHPPILQATDSKWWGWKSALESCGVIVDFICPEEIEKKFHKKMGES